MLLGPGRASKATVECPTAARPKNRGLRRLVVRIAVAVLSAYVVFLVAMNVFLSTSLFGRALNADPETIFITFERGWSLWPGRVHARKLVIRSSDSNVQFILRLDRCDFSFAPLDLALHKTFHVTRVTGSGITFAARQRAPSPSLTQPVVESLPAIAGFERLPLPALTPPNLVERWNDSYWHLWSVRLENVVADDVREVSIDTMRWTGEAHITGGFYLKPIRQAHVDDIRLTLRDRTPGKVTVLGEVLVEPIAGTVDLNIASFDPRTASLSDLVHLVTVRTDLHGRVPDLAHWPKDLTAPLMLGGAAELRQVAVRIVSGKLVSGSHVDVAVKAGAVELSGHRATGAFSLIADTADDAGVRLTFLLRARSLAAYRDAEEGELLHAALIEVAGDARALDLAGPLRDLHAIVSVPDVDVPDLRRAGAYVPAAERQNLALNGGRLHVRAQGELWYVDRRARGRALLGVEELDVRVGPARVLADATLEAAAESWHWDLGYMDGASMKLALASSAVARAGAGSRHAAEAADLSLALASASVDVRDPFRSFTAQLDAPRIDVLDEALAGHHFPKAGDLRLANGRARFDAHAAVTVDQGLASGQANVDAARLGVTAKGLRAVTDLRAVARVHDASWERGVLAVDEASIVLSNVALARGAETQLAVARAYISATSGRVATQDPLAQLHVKAAVENARVNDPTALNTFLPDDSDIVFDTEPGNASLAAQLDATIDGRVGRATATVGGRGVGVAGRKVAVRGDLAAIIEIADWRREAGTLRVKRSEIVLGDVAVRIGERQPGAPSPPPDVVATRIALSAVARQLDAKHPSLDAVDYHLVMEGAHMDDVRPLGMLVPGDPFAFAVESGKARAAIDLVVKSSDKTASGSAVIDLEEAGVRMRNTHLVGDFRVVAPVHGYAEGDSGLDVSGATVTMKNVRTAGAKAQAAGWSGAVTLLGGAVRVTTAPSFDGLVQLHFDDAQPILALTLQNSLPAFAVGMLKAPDLNGQARVSIESGRTAILGARVRGGDVQLAGNYVVAGERVRGAVTVAKGPLSAGVKFDDGATSVRLFRLDSWMKDETRAALRFFGETSAKKTSTAHPP